MKRAIPCLALLALACSEPTTTADGGQDAVLAPPDGTIRPDAPGSDTGAPPEACDPIAIEPATVDGFVGTTFTWMGEGCSVRTAHMVANTAADPTGSSGGYLRRITYLRDDGSVRTCDGSSERHPGFGYTVNHFDDTSSSSRSVRGTTTTVLAGRHHAIHEYRWDAVPIDGHDVAVIIRWTFVTGRDHPLWAITYDLRDVAVDAVNADTRSPYGDLQWDGGEGVEVDGVGWGDRYVFRSLDSPVDLSSGWDYTQSNEIPHVIEWSVGADAEMGLVQTQTYVQHDAGGYWAYDRWGMRDEDGPMPEDWNWTYQLNQYEIPFLLTSKRMAWGSNYGAVGQAMYPAYGDDRQLSGWPFQSYAVFVVLDEHHADPVRAQIDAMVASQWVGITPAAGSSVVTMVPAGAGRDDLVMSAPLGWDPVHAAWRVRGDGTAFSATIDFGWATVRAPTFRVEAVTGSRVTIAGAELVADADYYATTEPDGTVWITLARPAMGMVAITVGP